MIMQKGHQERISLFLIDSPVFPVVLVFPWSAHHDPTISWQQRDGQGMVTSVFREVYRCFHRCNNGGEPNQVSTMHIPPEYAVLALAFRKKKAT
jgi:hypothetical protein